MGPLTALCCSTTCQLVNCNSSLNQASSCGFMKPSVGKQISPTKKALRVTMLKTRFADIILKAQQTLNSNEEKEDTARMRPEKVDFVEIQQKEKQRIESQLMDDKAVITHEASCNRKMKIVMKRDATFLASEKDGIDKARMRHEKENFTEKQQEKKRRIEAQVKATKATVDKANSERKMRIEKESEAARLALDKDGIDKARLMQHEKKDFTEKQQEKKKRINEAQVKSTKATIDKANYERKMKIEKQRQAARLALEKVEASVYIDDFTQTYKEFMKLISSQSDGVK